MLNLILVKPQYLSILGLYQHINYLKKSGQNSIVYEQALWSKIINPFTIMVMILIALPLVRGHVRNITISQRVAIGCLIGVSFHIINQISGHTGVVYGFNPFISVTFPTIFASGILAWLLHKAA